MSARVKIRDSRQGPEILTAAPHLTNVASGNIHNNATYRDLHGALLLGKEDVATISTFVSSNQPVRGSTQKKEEEKKL
ncbi:hypothetical protein RRG08_065641 [Elysia crispata]|uniref:Uncharacterized protein n=1 Tax=Elysia crispata TaxID=231223 RepID=A0AAE0YMV7_9GAST|nr:hypothetical protein RRG08_065641 [Elysia crispata]